MNKILSIAINTFRESVRSKILYSILIFAVVIITIASLFGSVTIGDEVKVLKDFGLFSLSFFGVAYIVITGSTLLNKELSKKTIYNLLSKPVKRSEFVLGKFIGMFLTVTLLQVLMGLCFMVFIALYEENVDFNILYAVYSIILQMFITCAAVMFFSTIVVTPMLSGAFAFGFYIIGRSSEYIKDLISRLNLENSLSTISDIIHYLIPQLDKIDISNQVVYGTTLSPIAMTFNLTYTIGYAGVLLTLACIFFNSREFN